VVLWALAASVSLARRLSAGVLVGLNPLLGYYGIGSVDHGQMATAWSTCYTRFRFGGPDYCHPLVRFSTDSHRYQWLSHPLRNLACEIVKIVPSDPSWFSNRALHFLDLPIPLPRFRFRVCSGMSPIQPHLVCSTAHRRFIFGVCTHLLRHTHGRAHHPSQQIKLVVSRLDPVFHFANVPILIFGYCQVRAGTIFIFFFVSET